MFGEHFHHDRKVYVWVTALTWAASLFDFFKTLPEQVQVLFHLDKAVTLAQTFLPLFNLNLGWILPAMVGMIIGLGGKRNEKRRRAGTCVMPAIYFTSLFKFSVSLIN